MSTTELKIPFPTEKLDALRFFIVKKGLEVEQELKDALDKTYEKVVPAHVREYVESRAGQGSAQEQTAAADAPDVPDSPRRPRAGRRRQEQAAAETAPATPAPQPQGEDSGPAADENQGMNMSM